MHDWTLVSLNVNWKLALITINLLNSESNEETITARGFTNLKIPKKDEWGRSVSVNEIVGPSLLQNGCQYLEIEIQSGDKIEIEAKEISLPNC